MSRRCVNETQQRRYRCDNRRDSKIFEQANVSIRDRAKIILIVEEALVCCQENFGAEKEFGVSKMLIIIVAAMCSCTIFFPVIMLEGNSNVFAVQIIYRGHGNEQIVYHAANADADEIVNAKIFHDSKSIVEVQAAVVL